MQYVVSLYSQNASSPPFLQTDVISRVVRVWWIAYIILYSFCSEPPELGGSLYAVAVEIIIFTSCNAFWPENLRTLEISQSIVRCWNMELCCFCRAKGSSATHRKKRKLLHRDACTDARFCLLAILNQRRGKGIEAFAEISCSIDLLCFQCIGELDRLETLRRSFQDLDASSPVKGKIM